MDLADLDTLRTRSTPAGHHNALRRGLNLEEIDGAGILQELTALARSFCPNAETVWRLLDQKRREGKRILVRGRAGRAAGCRSRHLSLRHLVQHRRGASGDRHRMGPSAVGYVLGYARPIRPGSARGRFRPSRTMRPAARSASAGVIRHNTGRPRRCRLFDAMLGAPDRADLGINGLALTNRYSRRF